MIQRREHPPWTVLEVVGELDVAGAPELRQAVVVAVANGSRWLVLDLSRLDFIDSFGLGVIVGALKRARQRNGDVRLVCPVPRIRRVFEMCDLDRAMTLNITLADALDDAPLLSAGQFQAQAASSVTLFQGTPRTRPQK